MLQSSLATQRREHAIEWPCAYVLCEQSRRVGAGSQNIGDASEWLLFGSKVRAARCGRKNKREGESN